jgi:protein TonB
MTRLTFAAAFALSGSLLLHGAGMLAFPAAPDHRMTGGDASVPPALCDSFADLSQGMAEAAQPVAPLAPATAQAVQPVVPVAAVTSPRVPDGIAPVRPETAPSASPPVAAALPAQAPAALAAAAAPAVSPRPLARPAEPPVPVATPKLVPRPEPPPAQAAEPGAAAARGGETAARTGTATGRAQGTGNRAAAGQQVQGDGGQASQASYGRAVMRKISSTRKKSTSLRGTVVIAFGITANGGLASAHVARSSGSVELDALGLDHIRRAAPFPPPPGGAPTRFSVEFQGR